MVSDRVEYGCTPRWGPHSTDQWSYIAVHSGEPVITVFIGHFHPQSGSLRAVPESGMKAIDRLEMVEGVTLRCTCNIR